MEESLSVTHPQKVWKMKPAHSLSAWKALAQHVLVDQSVLEQIFRESEAGPEDTIVEVGPGRGVLTRGLVRRAKRVIAVEMDPHLAASLPETLDNPPNLRVINADAREVDLTQVLQDEVRYKLVANLPYYAANPIIRRFLESEQHRPFLMMVMVQREVAERMVAEGGRMSLLAVGIQLYGIPRIICEVPPRAFAPPPKVTSAVVRIDPRPHSSVPVEDVAEFFNMVRAGFSAPRKQLRNSLSLGLGVSAQESGRLLEVAGLDPAQRAETLSLEEWWKLYQASRRA